MRVSYVATIADLERVRLIRNACREWMTGDRHEIGPAEQLFWWRDEPRRLWLFDDVGYAYLSEREGRTWISLGVLPEYRGLGLGSHIYSLFPDVWAEIRADNKASRRAAEKAGYELVSEDGDLVLMRA